jgi:membrane protein DedA with SNARE-associated domain
MDLPMVQAITQWIMELIQSHGPLSVFIGVMIESIIVPIPSPMIIMGAGAILIDPDLSFSESFLPILSQIVVPGAIASTVGAYIAYGLCYWGGKPIIQKCKGFLGFSWEDLMAMEERLVGNKSGILIFLLRALPIMPLSLISAAAGSIRMKLAPFSFWTFLGSIPRCFFLGYLGWLLHDSYVSLAQDFNFLEGIMSGLIVAGAIIFVIWLRFRIKRNALRSQ